MLNAWRPLEIGVGDSKLTFIALGDGTLFAVRSSVQLVSDL